MGTDRPRRPPPRSGDGAHGDPARHLGPWPEGFARGRGNRRALLVLSALRGLTPRRLLELAGREGSAAACLAAVRAGRAGSAADRRFAGEVDPDGLERALAGCGARMVTAADPEYPPSLHHLADPPAALFARGRALSELTPGVAVVGARNCSALGREVAAAIGRGLAGAGVCVVSGAARGIDAAAHHGALAAGGATVAVLGSGIDRPYPRQSARLLGDIAARGTVVSEYPPGVPPEAFRFPARNRIVAALAEAVVVVEGAAGSGSLITADHALDLGRQVFAVPGPVTNPLAEVPLALIREGAVMVRGPEDLLEDLGRPGRVGWAGPGPPDLSPAEEAVLASLAGPTLPEEVARSLGLPLPEALPLLLGLELRGLVRAVGGRYERTLLERG